MPFTINQNNKTMKLEEAILSYYSLAGGVLRKEGVPDEDVDDLMQDATLKILEADGRRDATFESLKQFGSYFIMTAKSVWKDSIRSNFRRKEYNETKLNSYAKEEGTSFSMSNFADDDADFLEQEHQELMETFNKYKLYQAQSHLECVQYLVMTLRKNGWPFEKIAQINGTGLSTALGQMRYSKLNVEKKLSQSRLQRKRFREGREGQADRDKMFFKLPPNQYFVIKMKETGLRFEDIAQLDGHNTNTTFYRWKLARKNLEVIAKNEDDYLAALDYLDSINTNVGGHPWHKPKEKVVRPLSDKEKWFLRYIEMNGERGPKQMGKIWKDNTGGSDDRSDAGRVMRQLMRRGFLKNTNGRYTFITQ